MLHTVWDAHAAEVLEALSSAEREMARLALSAAASDWERTSATAPKTFRLPPNEGVDLVGVRTDSGAWLLVSRSGSALRVHDVVSKEEMEVLLGISGLRERGPGEGPQGA